MLMNRRHYSHKSVFMQLDEYLSYKYGSKSLENLLLFFGFNFDYTQIFFQNDLISMTSFSEA